MSDDIPLSAAALLLAGDGRTALLIAILAGLLTLSCGLILGALLFGVAARSLQRPQAWRTLVASVIALGLATLAWHFALSLDLNPVQEGWRAGSEYVTYEINDALFGNWGDALILALVPAILLAVLAGSAGKLGSRGTTMSWSVALGYKLAQLLTPWAGARGNGRNGDEGSDFEITLASGEEVDADERELIENVLELGETTVREVMKPRPDVVALDVAWPADRIMAEVAGARYSRFPVYENTVDNVIGVLHLRDLFEFLARGDGTENFALRELLMEPLFIPESKKVDDALRELQKHKGHMAIVLDEYGGTAGIVTIEDLLEEIVGEIQDEYDDESKLVHQREDGSYVVTAQLPLDDLAELLNRDLDAEDVDTVGGYIVHALGRIPAAQDTLDSAGLRFTVLSVEKNRIGRVRIEPIGS
jgi:CBS domain containing-hemolysin-like protein